VAKIFHERQKSNTNRRKLEAMVLNNPNIPSVTAGGVEYVQIAWPEAVLEDDEGYCVGYVMPFINTAEAVSLDHLMQGAVRTKLGLSDKYDYRVMAAYNVALMVASLHKYGHYIIDLKPANVSIYKKTMTVAMFDCDGFSIQGERERYPAEFVSEEYIYPEGMDQTCEEMGEEQDKFALAVIIFKLLNNGIHPFSGVVKKNADSTLSIQERIAEYHYAYGMWGDSYQAPHPYSLHEFLPQSTLKLFDRAFMKGQQRPSAAEWQAELDYLLKNLKRCKKNPNHAYFTNKGCGLCASEERLKANLKTIQEQKTAPRKLRGFEVNTLSKEKMEEHKQQRRQTERQEERITYVLVMLYSLLMIFLPRLAMIYHETLQDLGISLQLILMILFFNFLHAVIKKQRFFLTKMLGSVILNTLITYTYGCVAMAFVLGNKIDWMHLFGLS
jgi:DNA-binding helix-hairpin-helix protein with protein kinase domain